MFAYNNRFPLIYFNPEPIYDKEFQNTVNKTLLFHNLSGLCLFQDFILQSVRVEKNENESKQIIIVSGKEPWSITVKTNKIYDFSFYPETWKNELLDNELIQVVDTFKVIKNVKQREKCLWFKEGCFISEIIQKHDLNPEIIHIEDLCSIKAVSYLTKDQLNDHNFSQNIVKFKILEIFKQLNITRGPTRVIQFLLKVKEYISKYIRKSGWILLKEEHLEFLIQIYIPNL